MRAEVMRKTESERQEKMDEVLKHELDVKKLKEKMEEEQRAEREKLDAEWEELHPHQEMFKEVTIAVDRVKRKHKKRWQVAASSSQNPQPKPDDDDPPGANLGNEQVGVLEDNESDSHSDGDNNNEQVGGHRVPKENESDSHSDEAKGENSSSSSEDDNNDPD